MDINKIEALELTNDDAITGISEAIEYAKEHKIRFKIVYLLQNSTKAHSTDKEGVHQMALAGSSVIIAADLLGKKYGGRVSAVFYPNDNSAAIICFRHEKNAIHIFRNGLWVVKLDTEYTRQKHIDQNPEVSRYLNRFKPIGG